MASQSDQSKFVDSESKENTLLLFTGGKGEPKCIDVDRCLEELPAEADLDGIGVLNPTDKTDFTDACPRVPLSPITFYFANDPSRSYSSFSKSRGVQFSYQAIYKKGFLSAPAPYSSVAIPPSILSAGTRPLSELLIENTCVLQIPKQGAEVEGVRIIVREGNDGVARRIEDVYIGESTGAFTAEVDTISSVFSGYYSFYNDIRGSVMSETDRLKTFDSVPRNAKAQEIAGDRLVYGNYTDGYSNIQTSTTLSVEFSEAPPAGYSFDLEAVPVVFRRKTEQKSDANQSKLETTGGIQTERYLTSAGFLLDDKLIPNTVGAGLYEVNITLAPSKNFHQFLGQNDVPNSMENVDKADFSETVLDVNMHPQGGAGGPNTAALSDGDDIFSFDDTLKARDFCTPSRAKSKNGQDYSTARGVNLDVIDAASGGVGFGDPNIITWSSTTDDSNATIGKTCRAPIIYQGGSLNFSATLNISSSVSKSAFLDGLMHALWGLPPSTNPVKISGDGEQEYPLTDDEWFATHEFDLGLNEKDVIDHEGSNLSELICAVKVDGDVDPHADGYGIVNAATMQFCLEPARGNATSKHFGETSTYGKYNYEDSNGNSRSLYGVKLTLANVKNFDFKSCIPLPVSGFGSLISPTVSDALQGNFDTFSNPDDKLKASLFSARATSPWDWDLSANGSSVRLAWPSIERNLCIPSESFFDGGTNSSVVYGPAKQNFENPEWGVEETNIQFVTDDNGTPFPAAGTAPSPPLAESFSFRQRQTLWTDFINDGENHVAWMPAPIGRWIVFDDPKLIAADEWSGIYGLEARMSTESSFMFNGVSTTSVVKNRPAALLRGITERWEGNFTPSSLKVTIDGEEYCKFSLYKITRPLSGDVSTYASGSPYSLVDGDMGPGGSSNAGTRALGERGDGTDDGWGFPLAMGTHDLNNPNINTVGRNANVRGSVTAFSLIGWTDNFPGYALQNISRNQPFNFNNVGGKLAVSNRFYNNPFLNHPPRYFNAKNCSQDSSTIKKSTGPVLPYSGDNMQVSNSSLHININALGENANVFFPQIGTSKSLLIPFTGSSNGSSMGTNIVQSNTDSAALGGRSFKTKASHEFGVVYYDKKGRHGAVQPIGSVYVPGYDSERTSGLYGAATVKIQIDHAPPEWAEHYRIVYAGNTSVDEFFQYTVANAFVSPDQGVADKIYLSLSHLQSSNISYTSSYGAVSQQDGSDRIYRFAPGDTLRILNYSDQTGQLVYMSDPYEYKVLGVENLIPSMEDHPLFSESQETGGLPDTDNAKNGEFLVIENNSNNADFASPAVSTGSSFWGRRCLVEVYRPKQTLGQDAPYFETNYGGRVIGGAGNKTHQYNTINMSKGDVFFRSVPMNVQRIVNNEFQSLVSGSSSNDTSESNFVPYFVETEGFTDSFISNTKDYGRIHFIDRDASEVERNYSLTFSEQTSLGSFQPRWMSFPQIGNFKDYSFEFGPIDLIDFDGQFINSFHENRVLKIPFQRNVLSTGDTDQVVASTKVLGTEAVIPVESGTFGHPESVIKIDGDYFFFDASRKRVIMLKGGKSPVVITDMGVKSYFRKKVDEWISEGGYRAPMGYDPQNKELLISLTNSEDSNSSVFNRFDEGERMMSMAFDLQTQKNWKTRYSFVSPQFATIGENLISFHRGSDNIVQPWIHDDSAVNNSFYNQIYGTSLLCAFGGDPTQIKEFESVVIDAEYPWSVEVKSGKEKTSIDESKFKRYNDRLYGIIEGASVAPDKLLATNRPSSIPTFPKNQHRGVWSSEVPQIKLEDGIFYVKMFMPSSHSMFKAPFASGKNSLLYEKTESGSLVPLGKDPRNRNPTNTASYRIVDVNKSTNSNLTELVIELSNTPAEAVQSLAGIGSDDFPIGGFDWRDVSEIGNANSDLVPTVLASALFEFTVLPLISYYFSQWGPSDYAAFLQSTSYSPTAELYDLNGDGFVSTSDLLELISDFGTTYNISELLELLSVFGSDIYSGDQVSTSTADIAAWATSGAPNGTGLKSIYSLFTNSKEPLTGRNVELKLSSDVTSPSSDLFSVEVGFNSRNKSMPSVGKDVRQRKKK